VRARAAGLLLLGLAAAPLAEAGPWGLGRGHAYVKAAYDRLRSTTLATPDGTQFEIPSFRRDIVSLYAAYGLSDGITLVMDVPLWRSSDLADDPDELGRESGLGDAQAGLQVQLGTRGSWTFAARGLVQAPTGDETRAQGLLPTGSGVWEGQLVLGAGRSLAGGKGWGFIEAGPQVRGGGLRDGVVFGAQLGYRLASRVLLAANLRGQEPWSHDAPEEAIGSFVGVGDRVTYVSFGPSVIVDLGPGLSLQADAEAVTRARNLAKGPVLRLGLAYRR
jgi:hypothetical protein